MADITT
jgi:multifunctional beta-oxidation protein